MVCVAIWFYVDDIIAQLPMGRVREFMASWQAVLPTLHMELKLPKCKIHIPARRRLGWTPQQAVDLAPLKASRYGIEAFGTEVPGDSGCCLVPLSDSNLGPVAARAVAACERALGC